MDTMKKIIVYISCAREGRKIEIWKKNPKVWGQAFIDLGYQKGICEHFYKTAQFEGTVSFIEEEKEKFEAMKYIIKQLEDEPDNVEELHFKTGLARLSGIRVGKVAITFLSGKIYNEENYVAT
jgi:nitroimidazol reductase NimA-like FMN-containing flavoprotein (pyridoxamine 5'-phosphate oxidase superfamily)